MEIIIEKNKEYAFQSFFRKLKAEHKGKPGMFANLEIPQDLVNRAGPLSGIKKDELNDAQKEVRNEAERFFERLWSLKQSEIDNVLNLLMTAGEYFDWLTKKIPDYTDLVWPYEKIFIYPNIHSWATKAGPYMSVGIAPRRFLEEDFVPVLVHELIHVNTDNLKYPDLRYPQDADEIADGLVTNKIVHELNSEFGVSIRDLNLPWPLRSYDKDLGYLNDITVGRNSFREILKEVDDFLFSHNHQEVYKNKTLE